MKYILGFLLMISGFMLNTKAQSLHSFRSTSEGFDTNSFFYDTGSEVIVFDAQFTSGFAEQLIDQIRKTTTSPITYVVVTHPNPDKFNGALAFQAVGAKVIASQDTKDAIADVHAYKKYFFVNVAGSFTEDSYPQQVEIDLVFENEYVLSGDVQLRVLTNAGVSSTQTVAYLPKENALIVGDLIHYKAHAWLEGGIVDGEPQANLMSWRRALEELLVYGNATVYGGRGDPAAIDIAVAEQDSYLRDVETITRSYLRDLDGNALTNLDEVYTAISQQIKEAYPDYAYPYMTDFSIYGLVTSLID